MPQLWYREIKKKHKYIYLIDNQTIKIHDKQYKSAKKMGNERNWLIHQGTILKVLADHPRVSMISKIVK